MSALEESDKVGIIFYASQNSLSQCVRLIEPRVSVFVKRNLCSRIAVNLEQLIGFFFHFSKIIN